MLNFYRVSNIETGQGLWYDFNGNFTGLIHNKFGFCKNDTLKMPFEPNNLGYLSAVESVEVLYNWFPKKDILRLQEHGYFIHGYESKDIKWQNEFKHWLINKESSIITKRIILL